MRVELDLFSGRSNPAWLLTAEEVKHFDALLVRLPIQAGAPPPLFDGLGYRGFKVTSLDQSQETIVQGRVVVVTGEEGRRWLADEGRGLERYLVQIARRHLDPDLYAVLLAQSGID